MDKEDILDALKLPQGKFRLSSSRRHCLNFAHDMQVAGIKNWRIAEMLSVLYNDAFTEAEFERSAKSHVQLTQVKQ